MVDVLLRRAYRIRPPSGQRSSPFGYRLARPRWTREPGRLRVGEPVVELHIRGEFLPPFPTAGPDLAWARRSYRAAVSGLRAIAEEVERDPRLSDARGVVGTAVVLSPFRNEGARRLFARLGLRANRREVARGRVAGAAEWLWGVALTWAYQERARIPPARTPVAELWIPMPEFLARYGAAPPTGAARPPARAATEP